MIEHDSPEAILLRRHADAVRKKHGITAQNVVPLEPKERQERMTRLVREMPWTLAAAVLVSLSDAIVVAEETADDEVRREQLALALQCARDLSAILKKWPGR